MKAKQKLRSNAGFTLAETLMAVLILLMVSAIVANGMPAAKKAYDGVVVGANAQILLSTAATALRDELGTAWNVEVIDGTKIRYNSSNTGALSEIDPTPPDSFDTPTPGIWLQEYASVSGLNDDEKSPRRNHLLVSSSASNGNLTVTYDSAETKTTENSDNTLSFSVIITELTVSSEDVDGLAKLDSLAIPVLSLAPTT